MPAPASTYREITMIISNAFALGLREFSNVHVNYIAVVFWLKLFHENIRWINL